MFSQLAAARGTCLAPVFVRPWRPNGVNFNETAHLLFHQSSASPEGNCGLFLLPLLSLLTLKLFRSLRAATKDAVFGICDFLKKIE